jgi:hypothetical protein
MCITSRVKGRFGGTYRLHFQGLIVSGARNQHEAGVANGEFLIEYT